MATGDTIKTYNNNSDGRRPRRRYFDDFYSNSKNFIKEFENFETGYNEMINILPGIKVYGGDMANYDVVVKKLLDIISENIPSPANPNYPNTLALTIKQNEVSFRTDDRIAFGWKIFFNKETGKHIYQMRVTFFSISMSTRKYADNFTSNGWEIKEFTREGKDRFHDYNHKGYNKNEKIVNKEDTTEHESKHEENHKEVVASTEVKQQEEKTENAPKKYWINKGAVEGVFLITFEGRTFVVNINDAAQPASVALDRNAHTIRVSNVVYDYEALNYYIDEGSSDFQEKEEEEEEFVVAFDNTSSTNTTSVSQGTGVANTTIRMTDPLK
jgi:hypothetical protein